MSKFTKGLLAIALAVVILVGGVGATLALSDSPADDTIKVALAGQLSKYPDNQLAILLAKVLLSGESKDENVGSLPLSQNTGPGSIANEFCYKDSDGTTATCTFWEEFDLPSATTTYSEVLPTDRDVFIDYAEIEILGYVSSTWNAYLGVVSSTWWAGGIAYNAGAGQRPWNLIDGYEFVTSSPTGTLAQYQSGYRNLISTLENPGTLGESVVRASSSTSRIVLFMQSDFGASCGSGTGVNSCQQVTSTNHNTGKVRYRGHYRRNL